ncbi:MAG: hypothetical protein M1486_03180, partial [Gammaproteobacteria bacterium]|nr:hypothetical protein [Gammaproteobacteria bacterium]
MKIVMTLMGKGGVGKSVASLIMAQYLSSKNEKLVCVDTISLIFNNNILGFWSDVRKQVNRSLNCTF